LIICGSVLLRMKNISDKSYRENQNTHFKCNIYFLNLAFYEIMWKNIAEPGRPQTTIRHMRIACWIPKATYTNSKYIAHFFSRQLWLNERASMLGVCIWCTVCLVATRFTRALLATKCVRRCSVMLKKKSF